MIDFHSHCLPAIDDGAQNAKIAVEMLVDSKRQGVDTVIATPHFYANGRTVESFIRERAVSYESLLSEAEKSGAEIPEIVLASEVMLGYSILELDDVDRLCIGNSDYMLVEMPFEVWNQEIYDLLYTVMIKYKVKPVIAHIERYIKINKKIENYQPLFDLGVVVQANAEGFLGFSSSRFLSRLISSDNIQVLGSDMHNMSDRKSRYGEAVRKIEKKFGAEFLAGLNETAEMIIKTEKPWS